MRYSKVYLDAFGYELAPHVVASEELEARLSPVYARLGMQVGQLEAFTGIRERRWWDPGFKLSDGAAAAGRKALAASGVKASDLGAVLYTGVCREGYEPATACAVAEGLGAPADAWVYDLSNACLGVMNGILEVANRIELGQIRAGLVTSCETAREINELTLERALKTRTMDEFKDSLATFTGGSGAVAVLLTDGSFGRRSRRLLGGAAKAAPQHHRICRWGVEPNGTPHTLQEVMRTDAVSVLKHGVALGRSTWEAFTKELGWTAQTIDKVICHQVGSANQREILGALGLAPAKDFTTFEYLGNIGTVSVPLTAALAEEREHLRPGDKVGFLGIGSGLNCLMLGWEW